MSRRPVAVSTLSLMVLLGAVACDNYHSAAQPSKGSSDARPAVCATPQLDWKMSLLPGKPHNTPAATLTATHKGPKPCAFDGYPQLDIWAGKGPSAESKPKTSTPVHLVLNPGHRIEFPVFYDPIGSSPGDCELSAELDPRVSVTPPHRAAHDYGTPVHLTDAKGKHVRAQVCGPNDPKLGAPRMH